MGFCCNSPLLGREAAEKRYVFQRPRAWGGGKHDFFVGDFVFVGIVFLFLVIFREQLLAALVGGGNSRFVFTPLDDCDFTMRAWQECVLLSHGFRAKK